jgi:hypothetical protein
MERLAEKLADIWKEYEEDPNITFTGIHKGILVKDKTLHLCKAIFTDEQIVIVYDDIRFSHNRFILYFLVKNFSVFFNTGILLENDKIQY